MRIAGIKIAVAVAWCLPLSSIISVARRAHAEEIKVECPPEPAPAPELARSETYAGTPFQPGEESKYELHYGLLQVMVGYGFLRVGSPEKVTLAVGKKDGQLVEASRWHRVFQAEAFTGDWYKMIFAGHDKLLAHVRPWDFGASKFYIKQDEEKPFVRSFKVEKWLNFNHVSCQVQEHFKDEQKKKEQTKEFAFAPGSLDSMASLYRLRTIDFKTTKAARIPVYTSEKNWWLEANLEGFEPVTTKAGTFATARLDLKSYLGKDLQQRGKMQVWIATDVPERPVVKVEGDVSFGSIYLTLASFTRGTN